MLKKILFLFLIFLFFVLDAKASSPLKDKLSGYILLQVENNGEAWYVNPENKYKYFLNRPADAFSLMKNFGIGISNSDLSKIPIGIIAPNQDSDADGLDDYLEKTIGTNPNQKDTDNDGYNDKSEIENNYNPNGNGALNIDEDFIKKNLGKIFLQTEKNGEAWYLNPRDKKRYFLGRPLDAWNIMRLLGLGISNKNLAQIPGSKITYSTPDLSVDLSSPNQTINGLTKAIRNGENVSDYFVQNLKKPINYSMKLMSDESKFMLANFFSGCSLESQEENTAIFKNEVYWQGNKHLIRIYLSKEGNDWLISKL